MVTQLLFTNAFAGWLRISDRDGLRLVCAPADWKRLTTPMQTDWRAEVLRTHAPAPAR